MSKHRKKQTSGPVWALLLVGLLGAGALAFYVKQTPRLEDPAGPSVSVTRRDPPPATTTSDSPGDKVLVFRPYMEGPEVRFTKSEATVPTGVDPRVFAVNEFLKASKVAPEGAIAVGVQVRDGVALMDFSPGFDRSYSTTDEKTMLDGLLTTLGQFQDVEKLQILINGEPIESLGNVEVREPLDVIRSAA
jgi:hypothetical protein